MKVLYKTFPAIINLMSTVLGVFAHPDDEAFGPGGTLIQLSKTHEVYTVCITDGEAGLNSLAKPDSELSGSNNQSGLADIRKEELLSAGKILGVKETFFLDYKDGSLSNNLYHEVASKIQNIVDDLKPEILLTYEPRGVSGHIDHVVSSLVTSFVFEKSESVMELWYYCNSEEVRATVKNYFIYWPPGYKDSEITKSVNIDELWETKVKAMKCHASQMHDVEKILERYKNLPKEESFIILKK